jgi:hypothetical protein
MMRLMSLKNFEIGKIKYEINDDQRQFDYLVFFLKK